MAMAMIKGIVRGKEYREYYGCESYANGLEYTYLHACEVFFYCPLPVSIAIPEGKEEFIEGDF